MLGAASVSSGGGEGRVAPGSGGGREGRRPVLIPDTGPAPPLGCSALPPAAVIASPSPPPRGGPLATRTPRARWRLERERPRPAPTLAVPLTLLRPSRVSRFYPRRPPSRHQPDPRPRCAQRAPRLRARRAGTGGWTVAPGAEAAGKTASAPPWPQRLTGQVPARKLHLPFPILRSLACRLTHARSFSRLVQRSLVEL